MKKDLNKTYLLAIIYAFIMGLSFLFVKIALSYSDPLNILAHRFTFAFLFIFILKICNLIKVDINKRDIIKILPLSLLYPAMFFTFQTFGLVYMSSSEAGIILATVPIFTLIFAILFLKEKTTAFQKFSVFLSVIGVIYIMYNKGISIKSTNFLGIVLITFSAISLASYNVLARVKTREFKTIELTYVMAFVGFVTFNTISIIDNINRDSINLYFSPLKNINFVIAMLYLGILSSVITSLLSNYVLSKLDASKMSVFANLGTVITIIAGVLILKEDLFYYHIIGIVMIILGIIGTNLKIRKTDI